MHHDIILSLQAIADPTAVSPWTTTFVPDRSIGQIDSAYESDLGLEIADCQVAKKGGVICGTIQMRRTFPNHQRVDAHRVKILLQVLEDHSAMLRTIESSIRQWQKTPTTRSDQKPTLIWPAGSSALR